jgi:hypothetical protein
MITMNKRKHKERCKMKAAVFIIMMVRSGFYWN